MIWKIILPCLMLPFVNCGWEWEPGSNAGDLLAPAIQEIRARLNLELPTKINTETYLVIDNVYGVFSVQAEPEFYIRARCDLDADLKEGNPKYHLGLMVPISEMEKENRAYIEVQSQIMQQSAQDNQELRGYSSIAAAKFFVECDREMWQRGKQLNAAKFNYMLQLLLDDDTGTNWNGKESFSVESDFRFSDDTDVFHYVVFKVVGAKGVASTSLKPNNEPFALSKSTPAPPISVTLVEGSPIFSGSLPSQSLVSGDHIIPTQVPDSDAQIKPKGYFFICFKKQPLGRFKAPMSKKFNYKVANTFNGKYVWSQFVAEDEAMRFHKRHDLPKWVSINRLHNEDKLKKIGRSLETSLMILKRKYVNVLSVFVKPEMSPAIYIIGKSLIGRSEVSFFRLHRSDVKDSTAFIENTERKPSNMLEYVQKKLKKLSRTTFDCELLAEAAANKVISAEKTAEYTGRFGSECNICAHTPLTLDNVHIAADKPHPLPKNFHVFNGYKIQSDCFARAVSSISYLMQLPMQQFTIVREFMEANTLEPGRISATVYLILKRENLIQMEDILPLHSGIWRGHNGKDDEFVDFMPITPDNEPEFAYLERENQLMILEFLERNQVAQQSEGENSEIHDHHRTTAHKNSQHALKINPKSSRKQELINENIKKQHERIQPKLMISNNNNDTSTIASNTQQNLTGTPTNDNQSRDPNSKSETRELRNNYTLASRNDLKTLEVDYIFAKIEILGQIQDSAPKVDTTDGQQELRVHQWRILYIPSEMVTKHENTNSLIAPRWEIDSDAYTLFDGENVKKQNEICQFGYRLLQIAILAADEFITEEKTEEKSNSGKEKEYKGKEIVPDEPELDREDSASSLELALAQIAEQEKQEREEKGRGLATSSSSKKK